MKFSAVTALFAAGTLAAAASPSVLAARAVSTITDAINNISDATTALNTGITGFTPSSEAHLQSLAQAVVTAINNGNTQVKPIPDISESDALTLQPLISTLSTNVNTSVSNAIAKKSAFVSAGAGGVVYTQLTNIQSATTTFSNTVISKVPTALTSIAQSLVAPINASLEKGIAAFQDQKGVSGSTSTSTSSSGASSTSTSSSAASSGTATSTSTSTSSAAAPTTTTSAAATSSTPQATTATSSSVTPAGNAAMPTAASAYGAAVMVALGVAAAL